MHHACPPGVLAGPSEAKTLYKYENIVQGFYRGHPVCHWCSKLVSNAVSSLEARSSIIVAYFSVQSQDCML